MKNILLSFYVCFIIGGLYGQQTNICFSSSHGYSYRYLYPNNDSDVDAKFKDSFIKIRNRIEKYSYSNQNALCVEKRISSKTMFIIGVGLQRKSVKLQFEISNFSNLEPRHDFEYNTDLENVVKLKTFKKDYYLILPLLFRYDFLNKKKLTFFGAFGIKPQIYLKSINSTYGYSKDNKILYRSKNIRKYDYYKLINLAFDVGPGIDYKISNHFAFRTKLHGDIDIFSNTTSPINERWYSLYLSLNIMYSI